MDTEHLLQRLADGAVHSGQALARELGVTRAAVWKRMQTLTDFGLDVEALPRRGYRLGAPLDLVDAPGLESRLACTLGDSLGRVARFVELESTNRYLLAHPPARPGHIDVCLAEYQSAGRGRRGRRWQAPLGACLCLSVATRFAETPPDLGALSLAVGAVAGETLVELTGVSPRLKWPNDLVVGDAKLGGILVELAAEAQGGCHVVIGLGVNVALPEALRNELCNWPAGATDLSRTARGPLPSRTELAAGLAIALACLLCDYPRTGFSIYRAAWRKADYLCGKPVSLEVATHTLSGTARGIDEDGALLIDTGAGEPRRIISGDVSVRSLA